jgi:putative membrane protein
VQTPPNTHPNRQEGRIPPGRTLLRGFLGGLLMGLANLVPGVSGGTMLVATGVYDHFVNAVARCSTLRLRLGPIVMLGIIIFGALLMILVGAGPLSELVRDHRWIMYSLFIGFTLGGVPLLWSMTRPMDARSLLGMISGIVAMAALALLESVMDAPATDSSNTLLLVITGAAAGAAMVLPGVSGSYLLLVLGQYVLILGAVDQLRRGDMDAFTSVLLPVAIGVVLGVVIISNIVAHLLKRARQATLGVLLGLLLGAVFGLWPFRAPVAPQIGDVIRGQLLENQAQVDAIDPGHWATAFFAPGSGMLFASLGLIVVGGVASLLISRLGRTRKD